MDVTLEDIDFDDIIWPYYDEYEDKWVGEVEGHINTSYQRPVCGRGCCGYETFYEKIPAKYLFDNNWRTILAADQAQAAEDLRLKQAAEEAAKAKRQAAEEQARLARRRQQYLQLQKEFGGSDV